MRYRVRVFLVSNPRGWYREWKLDTPEDANAKVAELKHAGWKEQGSGRRGGDILVYPPSTIHHLEIRRLA